jgi:flagellar protein FlgJ
MPIDLLEGMAAFDNEPTDLLAGIPPEPRLPRNLPTSKQQFIDEISPYAEQAAAELGISPQTIIAQAALETGWGRSVPGGNYFGIKAHGGWRGKGVRAGTHEYLGGARVTIDDTFRGYDSPAESFANYVQFLRENPRYTEALMAGAEGDDERFVREMHKAGYATDPQYSTKILSIANDLAGMMVGRKAYASEPAPGESQTFGREPIDLLEGLEPPPQAGNQPVDLLEGLEPSSSPIERGAPDETLTITIDQGVPEEVPSTWEAIKQGVLEGLNMGWSSESAAAVKAGLDWLTGADPNFRENYAKLESQYEQHRKAAEQAHPIASLGGEVVGSIPTLAAAGSAVRGVMGALPTAHPILASAIEGAATTAPYGAGKEEEDRLTGALKYGALGGALSAATTGAVRGVKAYKQVKPAWMEPSMLPEEKIGGMTPAAVTPEASTAGAQAVLNPPGTRIAETIDAVSQGFHKASRETIRYIGGKSISYLDDIAKDSPTAATLRAQIEHPERAYRQTLSEPIPADFTERVMQTNGRFQTRLESILKPMKEGIMKYLPSAKNKMLIDDLRSPTPTTQAGVRVRELLDDAAAYAKEAGLDLGYIEGYVPRVYNANYLRTSEKARQGLATVFEKYGIPAEDASDIVSRIIHEEGVPISVGQSMFRSLLKSGEKAFEKSRTLSFIPDAELEPFLLNDLNQILPRYLSSVAKRAEWARIFGKDGEKLSTMLGSIKEELAATGRSLKPTEEGHIIGLADAMRGAYKPITSEWGRAFTSGMQSYQYLRTMTLSLLSQPGEMWTGLERGGPVAFLKGLGEMAKNGAKSVLKPFVNLPKSESAVAVEQAGVAIDRALMDILRETNVTGSVQGKMQKVTEGFFTLNGMKMWNSFSRRLAFHEGRFMIGAELRKVAEGKPGKYTTQKLLELGIDPQQGVEWLKRGGSMTDEFYHTIEQGAIRFTNDVAMAPRAAVKPLWMSDPHFGFLAQLKPFQTVFGNTVVKRMAKKLAGHEGVAGVVNTLGASAIAMYTVANLLEFRKYLKYDLNNQKRPETDVPEWLELADRAGFTGVLQPLVDMRYQHRFNAPWYTSLFGPAMSQIGSTGQALIEASKGKTGPLEREVVNAIPVANTLPAVRKETQKFLFGEQK